jgi:hypothetical protein
MNQYVWPVDLRSQNCPTAAFIAHLSCLGPLVLLLLKLYIIWLSNLSMLSVPDEGYSRNAMCPIYCIFTFSYYVKVIIDFTIPLGFVYSWCIILHQFFYCVKSRLTTGNKYFLRYNCRLSCLQAHVLLKKTQHFPLVTTIFFSFQIG